jgi:hypothetical protein
MGLVSLTTCISLSEPVTTYQQPLTSMSMARRLTMESRLGAGVSFQPGHNLGRAQLRSIRWTVLAVGSRPGSYALGAHPLGRNTPARPLWNIKLQLNAAISSSSGAVGIPSQLGSSLSSFKHSHRYTTGPKATRTRANKCALRFALTNCFRPNIARFTQRALLALQYTQGHTPANTELFCWISENADRMAGLGKSLLGPGSSGTSENRWMRVLTLRASTVRRAASGRLHRCALATLLQHPVPPSTYFSGTSLARGHLPS